MKNFNKIYYNIEDELSNEDENDILETAKEQYIMWSDGVDLHTKCIGIFLKMSNISNIIFICGM